MMLSKLFTLGATLFAATSLALPAPEAPGSECYFHAEVQQQCNHGWAATSLTIPQIHTGTTTIKPKDGKRSSLSTPWNIKSLAKDFIVDFKDGAVTYAYGDDKWDGHHGDKFTCEVGNWSSGDLDCEWPGSRTQDMDCKFQCSVADIEPVSAMSSEAHPTVALPSRDDTPFDTYQAPLSNIAQLTGTDLAPSYAHGYCSFKLQLMQQCLSNPEEDWHNEILGNIFSIQDAAGKTAVSYPSGAGRIDDRIKLLTGMGDGLYLTHQNNKVWFRFDGGIWDTDTKDDGKAYGLCNWGKWSREEWGCEERLGGERRVSDIVCVFKC